MNRFVNRRPGIALLVALIMVSASAAMAQVKVSKVISLESIAGKKGIVYTLPHTIVNVDLVVLKNHQIPGPLAEYAREFLGTGEVILKDNSEYSIDHACLSVFDEPDPGQVYLVEKGDKSQGEIWINFGQGKRSVTIGNYLKGSGPGGFNDWDKDEFQAIDAEGVFSRYSSSAVKEVVDTVIRKISIDTLIIEEKMLKRSMVEYPDRDKAQEAIDQIRRIEGDMYNLLIGYQETPYSRDALEFMYDKLQKERQDYLSLFTGVSVTERLTFHFVVTPDPGASSQRYNLAGFSPTGGLSDEIEANAITLVLLPDTIWNNLSDASIGQIAGGIVYRVPVIVPIRLEYKSKVLVAGQFEIKQFGSLLSLPPEFKKVELDLEQGTVKSVVIE